MKQGDISDQIQQKVVQAYESETPLNIVAGNSKRFYGLPVGGRDLSLAGHSGIVSYEPSELVVTVRAATRLTDLIDVLAENRQMLAFEPPMFSDSATIGGTVSCNLSGPRRAYTGAVRDYVLGCRLINGKGELLRFGGEVIKNVAGYDVSRLVTGAMGCLGVITEVSLKVLPLPEKEITLSWDCDAQSALDKMRELSRQPLPLSATCYVNGRLYVRFSGSSVSLNALSKKLAADLVSDGDNFWQSVKEHQYEFFRSQWPLWRFSLAPDQPPLPLQGQFLYEWGGALRWYLGSDDVTQLARLAEQSGGHLCCFRHAIDRQHVFHSLSPAMKKIHNKLKMAFDPGFILNRGKMYAWM